MTTAVLTNDPVPGAQFIDRRTSPPSIVGTERRQFANNYQELSTEAAELAQAIDGYKLAHRRRFINFEEMLSIMKQLGYSKNQPL